VTTPPPVKKKLFKLGSLVTCTGVDIQRVVEIDDDGITGRFKCLSDLGQNYEIGGIQKNSFTMFHLITEVSFLNLYQVAKGCGWFFDVDIEGMKT
jgi:2-phospho-L-lactate transferase/gluconeogenesis factor (CofD/UPF0052 family)